MKANTTLIISNPHEVARLLNLIEDGHRVLNKQNRTQRGIDGYTKTDLINWGKTLSEQTNIRCEFANGEI